MIKLGSHVSFKAPDYLVSSNNTSLKNGANAMMIYLGPPQSTIRVEKEKYKLYEYEKLENKISKDNIIVHAPYIINPASPEKHSFAIQFLISEIERMNYLGLKYLVLHPGAHTKFKREDAINTLISAVKTILKKTKEVVILLETMAGKGTELGNTFEELKLIIDKINSDRVGICLDTCHIWDAGYDLKNYSNLISQLKKAGIFDLIKVLHINDSKNPLGSKKDRHANIGKGFIGTAPLKKIVKSKDFENIVKILETPFFEGKPIYDKEIKLLLE